MTESIENMTPNEAANLELERLIKRKVQNKLSEDKSKLDKMISDQLKTIAEKEQQVEDVQKEQARPKTFLDDQIEQMTSEIKQKKGEKMVSLENITKKLLAGITDPNEFEDPLEKELLDIILSKAHKMAEQESSEKIRALELDKSRLKKEIEERSRESIQKRAFLPQWTYVVGGLGIWMLIRYSLKNLF